MSAQVRQSGPAPSMMSRSPVPPHSAHVQSLTGWTTIRSGGAAWRLAMRSRCAAGTSALIHCDRQAASSSGSPLAKKRSGWRPLVAET